GYTVVGGPPHLCGSRDLCLNFVRRALRRCALRSESSQRPSINAHCRPLSSFLAAASRSKSVTQAADRRISEPRSDALSRLLWTFGGLVRAARAGAPETRLLARSTFPHRPGLVRR